MATVIAKETVVHERRSEADGLGRLVKVTEQNPANGNPEWETSYSYNALDNLTQINQGGQLRTFEYDAKGRLTSETLPEAGTTTYTYTDFDAVSARTDARGVVTTYQYGSLNLLTGVSYNTASAPGVAATAPVSFTYRSASPGKVQIDTVTGGAGNESYSYDSFGRLQSCTRVIDGISYEKRYEYNSANQMTLMTYPSGRRVKVAHDARGRLAALQRVDASGGVQESYLSEINYRADGLISSQRLGNGATESFGYSNDRLQLTSQTVTKGSNTLLNLSYGYEAGAGQMGSGSTTGNSGQLVIVNGTINGQGRNQAFTYDNVGRLVTATGWGAWARRHDYDRYGNRTAVWDAALGGNQLQNTIIGQVGGIKTNRVASVNGTAFSHDAGGNVTGDGARAYTYDAENRIVSVSGAVNESYGYDAGNRRVKKVSGGVVTHYIWEGNHVIAEYERGAAATQAMGTRYYHRDRMSTRVITDGAGAVVGTTDQAPFGEEMGVSGEGEKHKFTNYERDNTGLDYAVNRHYDPRQGRFNQVDPLGMGASSLADPQGLNLYSYVQNDPVNFVDPSGLQMAAVKQKGGGGGAPTCLIDGAQANCSTASNLVKSGAGVVGPLETTRWNPKLFKGQGGFEHFRVDASGNASWGYWDRVILVVKGDAGNVLDLYTGVEWYRTRFLGSPGIWKGELAFDGGSGVIRDFNGGIIGERPIEMQMLGPLDYIGVGEIKAGIAVAGVLRIGLRGLARGAARPTFVNLGDDAAGTVLGNVSRGPRGYHLPGGDAAEGSFDFVIQGGTMRVGTGHAALSQGAPVEYAGRITFRGGAIVEWTNVSGHFRPAAAFAGNAGLPMGSFRPVQFPTMVGGSQFPVYR
jgi:RHS repeat-associated protein